MGWTLRGADWDLKEGRNYAVRKGIIVGSLPVLLSTRIRIPDLRVEKNLLIFCQAFERTYDANGLLGECPRLGQMGRWSFSFSLLLSTSTHHHTGIIC